MKVKEPLFEYISSDISHNIINGDSLKVLKGIEDEKFDLIITSPPYNVGKSYETKTSIEKYLETQEEIINELVRTGNPLGKNPSDIWEIVAQDWETAMWDIPNVKSNHPEKTEHPCQFRIELVERCVLALTDEKSWVLDPYAGVGSTVVASIRNN